MTRSLKEKGKVSRQNQLKRILSHSSQESALSISELLTQLTAAGFAINRKTVERDIEDISLNHPLSEVDSSPRRFFFDGDFKLDFELVFDEAQLQTIILALQSLKQMSPGVLKGLCSEVETTLVSKLPRLLATEFERLKSISHASPTVLGEGEEIAEGVMPAVLMSLRKGRVFSCHYASSLERVRFFAPLKLHFAGAPYLYVYDCEDEVIKLLKISRIRNVEITQDVVDLKRSEEIKLDYVFGGYGKGSEEVVDYIITCTSPMAQRFKEHKIHPTQKIEVLRDGHFKISFTVHDSLEVVRLLAQYGEFIKNIEPSDKYQEVKAIWEKGLAA